MKEKIKLIIFGILLILLMYGYIKGKEYYDNYEKIKLENKK